MGPADQRGRLGRDDDVYAYFNNDQACAAPHDAAAFAAAVAGAAAAPHPGGAWIPSATALTRPASPAPADPPGNVPGG